MMRRVTSALLLSGFGLYRYSAAGRIVLEGVYGEVDWGTQLDLEEFRDDYAEADIERFYDWYRAISTHTVLRRASDDAYAALADPHEALVFVYRGFEWIQERFRSDVG